MLDLIISVLTRTIIAGTPLLLATLGEILAERAGILNLGIEGLMSAGAVTAFIITFNTGSPWLGLFCAILVGALIASIHGFICISLRANQVVSGLAITLLGLGVSGLWGKPYIGRPLPNRMPHVDLGFLSDLPIVGKILFSHDWYVYLSIVLGLILWFLMKHSRMGITLRSVGENPKASESPGHSREQSEISGRNSGRCLCRYGWGLSFNGLQRLLERRYDCRTRLDCHRPDHLCPVAAFRRIPGGVHFRRYLCFAVHAAAFGDFAQHSGDASLPIHTAYPYGVRTLLLRQTQDECPGHPGRALYTGGKVRFESQESVGR